jgi:hypothetical protein
MYEGIRNRKVEREQKFDNSVKTSFLSQEELKKYRGEKQMELTKELYIERKKKGLSDSNICKEFGIHSPALSNKKSEWGLGGMQTKDFQENVLPKEANPATIVKDNLISLTIKEHEQILKSKLADLELKFEKARLAQAKDYEYEMNRVKEENCNLIKERDQLKDKLKEQTQTVVQLMGKAAKGNESERYKRLYEASVVLLVDYMSGGQANV